MTSTRGPGSTLVKIARSRRLLHRQQTGRHGRLTSSSGGEDLEAHGKLIDRDLRHRRAGDTTRRVRHLTPRRAPAARPLRRP
ncbi:hypothetical protein, partial [Nocardioides guangzhouensis]|uniref:hypothetical protein n=1 Tax=Nocardioides guangzhouensis TaxID=2497878 RepID=UPI001C37D0C0